MLFKIPFRKITIITTIIIVLVVAVYVFWVIYNSIATSIIERKIREAGLNPKDYDLRGIAPWNVREFVTNKEIEKIEKEGFKSK